MEKQGKKISELRVVDLRLILEKRGLEKAGNKSVLIERLSKSLVDEGLDPNTYVHTFDANNDSANDSVVSETSQAGDNADISESRETFDDDPLETEAMDDDNEAAKESGDEPANTPQAGEEELSFQDGDKMVEVDSLAADQMDSNDVVQDEQVNEADSGATPTKEEEASIDNTNLDLDRDTHQDQIEEDGEGDNAGLAPADGDTANVGDIAVESSEPANTEVNAETAAEPKNAVIATADSAASEEQSKLSEGPSSSAADTDGTFVVHIDESDTNLDYDLNVDKPEERDAPTPTKDESMDVDASDIIQSNGDSEVKETETDAKEASTTPSQTSKSSVDTRTETPKKDSKDLASSQNLWISGLSSLTRATDLKSVFSKHGKVIGAKVVTNANRPGAKCYGYVTMSSSEEAAKCIQHLHRTELHGRMISVEKAKSDPAAQARASAAKKPSAVDDKKQEEPVSSASQETATAAKDESRPAAPSSHRSEDKSRHSERDRHRLRSAGSAATATKKDAEPGKEGEKKVEEKKEKTEPERKADEYLEREKRRLRLLERRARDDDYRRRSALLKEKRDVAEQQRRMRMDEERLVREREKIRMDREKVRIEEMKLESLQGERSRLENQLIELRQRVDREREELKRVETLRLEEMRRTTAVKRSYETSNASRSSGGTRYDDSWENKRPASNDRYAAGIVERRSTGNVSTERGGYSERRGPPEVDRRGGSGKEGADRGGSRSDERYSSRTGGASSERRDYVQGDRNRETSRSVNDSRGVRNYHEGTTSSRRSGGGTTDRQAGWNGSSGAPSLLSGPSNELFSGAAVQAAGMMMNAAMSRGGSGTANGTSSRYSGGGGNYSGTRRY